MRSLKTTRPWWFFGIILLGFVLMNSCSKPPSPSNPVRKQKPDKPDPEVRREGNKIIINDLETGGEVVFGSTEELPKEFPTDIPVIPECKMNNYLKAKKNTLFVTFDSSLDIKEVKDFYLKESHFQEEGWEFEDAHETPTGYDITLRKEKRRIQIVLSIKKNPDGTQISYVTQAKE